MNLRRASPAVSKIYPEIFKYTGEQIPRTPSTNRPKGRGIKPQKGYALNKKQIHLGYFNSPEEARDEYINASKKYHGEFGRVD